MNDKTKGFTVDKQKVIEKLKQVYDNKPVLAGVVIGGTAFVLTSVTLLGSLGLGVVAGFITSKVKSK